MGCAAISCILNGIIEGVPVVVGTPDVAATAAVDDDDDNADIDIIAEVLLQLKSSKT